MQTPLSGKLVLRVPPEVNAAVPRDVVLASKSLNQGAAKIITVVG